MALRLQNAWAFCGAQAYFSMAFGVLVPQPGINPVHPTLQGRFLTTGPPRKSPKCILHGRTWSISLRFTVIVWTHRLDFLIKCVFYCGGGICERTLDKLLRRQNGRWEYQRAKFILWLSLAPFGSPEETKILHRASFSSCNG